MIYNDTSIKVDTSLNTAVVIRDLLLFSCWQFAFNMTDRTCIRNSQKSVWDSLVIVTESVFLVHIKSRIIDAKKIAYSFLTSPRFPAMIKATTLVTQLTNKKLDSPENIPKKTHSISFLVLISGSIIFNSLCIVTFWKKNQTTQQVSFIGNLHFIEQFFFAV